MERLSENSRGITLIALIITVVIMLILAGVAISAVIDDGGLFSKTREAVAKYENSVEVENSQLQNLLAQIDATLDGTEIPGTESKIGVKTVEGMVPVTYNDGDSSWYVATEEEMYGKKVTSEGSMYVWIPRFAYKIPSGYHTDQAGEIQKLNFDKSNFLAFLALLNPPT